MGKQNKERKINMKKKDFGKQERDKIVARMVEQRKKEEELEKEIEEKAVMSEKEFKEHKLKITMDFWERKGNEIIDGLFPKRIAKIVKTIDIEANKPAKSLFLFGTTGTGKTIYACSMLVNEVFNKILQGKSYKKCYFLPFDRFIAELKETINTGKSDISIIKKYAKADFLVFDDIFSMRESDWYKDSFYHILTHRTDEELPTIFTCNHSPQELIKILKSDRFSHRFNLLCGDPVEKRHWQKVKSNKGK